MTYLKSFIFLSLITLLSFSSCKDPNEYRIDPAFTNYLKRFTDSAAVRGRTFGYETEGLIIEFANLKKDIAGLTHYENPIRVEIDRTYWENISKTAGADEMKENLIFHELGHGLLKRKHLNSTLENGEWKSIMCGGKKINDRPWNINYKGMRRLYYINELFNESTPAPEFSSVLLTADTTGYIFTKHFFNFNTTDKNNFGWNLTENNNYKISFDNGRMVFESRVDDIYLVYAQTDVNIQSDFSYELTMEYPSPDPEGHFGIIFGYLPDNSNNQNDPIEYFSINKEYKMRIGNRSWYSFFTELTENNINPAGRNKLKVIKTGKLLYYFINDKYSYYSEIETKTSGYHFGFIIPAKGKVLLDNFIINKRTSSNVSYKVNESNKILKFNCRPIKSLEQNLIYK